MEKLVDGPNGDLASATSLMEAEYKWGGICGVTAILAVVVLVILFFGEPDIHDAIIHSIMN